MASRFASACAMRASRWTAAACGMARLWMYPVGSSISWICKESTMSPSFSISVPQAAFAIDTKSSPTLKMTTPRTLSGMPWWVTQSSASVPRPAPFAWCPFGTDRRECAPARAQLSYAAWT
ncbi:hypothetical protein ADL12_36105 [Streptomyces regalis]|uniref:Secreted protein n=1 Tax=Streptomyces regalis TaxID=68262 RepID=A0A117MM04_9ACTN|nr:hypothetical protein ADL12_36105 [Streptomyces regalis]